VGILRHVRVEVIVSGLKGSERTKALIDTGATCSMLPMDLAKRIGVIETPLVEEVKFADGSIKRLPVCLCYTELGGRRTVSKVLLGSDEPILGVLEMEAMGLKVDSATGAIEFTRGYEARA
jgi:predicted aspartyl protease